jgi:hypothetical protein
VNLPDRPTNNVMRQEARLAPLHKALRRRAVRGTLAYTLAYLSDLPPEQLAADRPSMEDYFLTRFALVPWVLDARNAEGLRAIAQLRRTRPEARRPSGFRIVKDFGDGVLLPRKGNP